MARSALAMGTTTPEAWTLVSMGVGRGVGVGDGPGGVALADGVAVGLMDGPIEGEPGIAERVGTGLGAGVEPGPVRKPPYRAAPATTTSTTTTTADRKSASHWPGRSVPLIALPMRV
jgi:hypothetical protein